MTLKINGADYSEYVLVGGITFSPAPEIVSVKFINGRTRAAKLADLEDISISFGLMSKAETDSLRALLSGNYVSIETDEGEKTYWDARLSRRQRYILDGEVYYDEVVLTAKEA